MPSESEKNTGDPEDLFDDIWPIWKKTKTSLHAVYLQLIICLKKNIFI